jgi:hypothetical protein
VFDHSLHSGGFYIITDPESVIEKEKRPDMMSFTKSAGQIERETHANVEHPTSSIERRMNEFCLF